jgi:thiosulfate reductase cytochrome b subunit
MTERIYHYPLWIRLWHWINALLCLTLIFTGLSMQFSGPNRTLIPFEIAVSLHNISAIFLTINYIFFLAANWLTVNSRYYKVPEKGYIAMILMQFKYYSFRIFIGEKVPFPINADRKFNPLQQFSYIVVMYGCLPFIFVTGWAMLFPEIIIQNVFGISGLFLTDLVHIINGFLVSIFLIVHVYFCTMGATVFSIFKGMISGWAEVH